MAKNKVTKIIPYKYDGYSISLETEKSRDKFIKRVERIVRSSMEYRDYVRFLKENIDLTRCLFFPKVDGTIRGISIEQHHEPFGLYDITNIVLERHLQEGISLTDLLIAEEVIDLHYRNLVGFTPLSKTIHQVITNSKKIIVPLFAVYGNYAKFIEEYDKYIDDLGYIYPKLELKIHLTKTINSESFKILNPEFTYLEVEGFPLIEKISEDEREE